MKNFDTVIVGAGLSGLVIGSALKKAGQNVLLIEKSSRSGGVLRSERKAGFLLEHGPNTVPAKPHLIALIKELGLIDELLVAKKNTGRFIEFHDRLHRVPPGPLSFTGILRAFTEPFVTTSVPPADETAWDFFERRFGVEVAERLVAPFVSGIWAGDAKSLSLKSAFPSLSAMEKNHGSVAKGLVLSKKKLKSSVRGLVSFRNGIQTLADRLADKLSGDISLNTTVNEITANPWTLQTTLGPITTKQLVLTLPTAEAANLLSIISPDGADALRKIPYAPIKVLHLGFKRSAVRHSLVGFGYLVAPSEGKNILGCLWSSSIFPGRAPEGQVLLTVFMGGMTNREIVKNSDQELIRLALTDLNPILGLQDAPSFQSITTYEKAIPQYTVGHAERIQKLEEVEKKNPGLYFAGNYRSGISVGDVINSRNRFGIEPNPPAL